MKNETTVGGITLTRAQVEAALADLNTSTFTPRSLVRYYDDPSRRPLMVVTRDLLDTTNSGLSSKTNWALYTPVTDGSMMWPAFTRALEPLS